MSNKTNRMCGVCELKDVRLAIRFNEVNICYDCLRFLNNMSNQKRTSWIEEVDYQTNYIKNSAR